MRVDKFLAEQSDLSRARIQDLIKEGCVTLNGKALASASLKLKGGGVLTLEVPEPKPTILEAEDIPIDVIYEDDELLVINKSVGMVVHPGAGNRDGTLVNALLHYCKGNLSGIGGVERPGIVHRLDKDTSGLIIVAKTDQAHQSLSAQLADRTLSRVYQAIVLGVPVPLKGRVDKPIGRSPANRLKMSVKGRTSKEAITHYKVLRDIKGAFSLVECKLQTGRTHQIRVHMQSLGYPLIGDSLYGPQDNALRSKLNINLEHTDNKDYILGFSRQALHAGFISFSHPISGKVMDFVCDMPEDMVKLLEDLNK